MPSEFINSAMHQLKQYKQLGEEVLMRIPENYINWKYNHENNSIAGIVKHMTNNMCLQRSNIVTSMSHAKTSSSSSISKIQLSRSEIMEIWNQGWECLFHSLDEIDKDEENDFSQKVGAPMNLLIQQLAHYPFHIGQIIYIEKMIRHQQNGPIHAASNNFFAPELMNAPEVESFLSRKNIEDEPGNDTIL